MAEELSYRLEKFEGPLDLLLHLIEKNKINIYDIPIAEITDQYMAYMAAMDHTDLELVSSFLVMAATLLQPVPEPAPYIVRARTRKRHLRIRREALASGTDCNSAGCTPAAHST